MAKKIKKAVALSYRSATDSAPRLTAKGRGAVAEGIIRLAEVHGIPLYEDPDLSAIMDTLDIDAEIPPELFRAVAEVLAFVYRLSQRPPD